MILDKASAIRGTLHVPGDYSITQKAIAIASICEGKSRIYGYLDSCETNASIAVFRSMGIDIDEHTDSEDDTPNSLYIYGKGMHGLYKPVYPLDIENNSMTFRMLCGILAGQAYTASITGNDYIKKYSQEPLIRPLRQMGAKINGINDTNKAPLTITGRLLKGIQYVNTLSTDEVKAAVLLTGLYAKNKTIVYETRRNRNHMEILLNQFGATVEVDHTENSQGKNFCDSSTVYGCLRLEPRDIYIPGDFTYASCFITAALLIPESDIFMPGVGVNSTRIGFLNACIQMGGNIEITNLIERNGERLADIRVRSSRLNALRIPAGSISTMIDELPLLCLVASFAHGTTIISGISDLKDADADCLNHVKMNLANMGVKIAAENNCLLIQGGNSINGADIISNGDYRLIMAMSVAGMCAERGIDVPGSVSGGRTTIADPINLEYRYPGFYEDFKALSEDSLL